LLRYALSSSTPDHPHGLIHPENSGIGILWMMLMVPVVIASVVLGGTALVEAFGQANPEFWRDRRSAGRHTAEAGRGHHLGDDRR
jgi:hypothetical protein